MERKLAAAGLCRLMIEVRCEFRKTVDKEIRRVLCELVGTEAVSHPTTPGSCIARRLHVHSRVTYQHGLLGRSAKIAQQNAHSRRIGLFAFEAVAAVDVAEVGRESQSLEDLATE